MLPYLLDHRLDSCAARNQNLDSCLLFLVFVRYNFEFLHKIFIFIFRSRSRSPAKPTSNISSIVKPAILREEPIPGSEQGNLLKGIDKQTSRREKCCRVVENQIESHCSEEGDSSGS